MEYPDGYTEHVTPPRYPEREPWPHYGDPRDGTQPPGGPIIDGTNVRPDVLTDRDALVALRAWVLQERDAALRVTIGHGTASSLRYAIAMTDVGAVLFACISKLPPDLRILGERPTPYRRPRAVPPLQGYAASITDAPLASIADGEATDPALSTLDRAKAHRLGE
jgi:hypothetical protein